MFIGFDLNISENSNIFNGSINYYNYRSIGMEHLNEQKAVYEKELENYITDKEVDGTKIQDEWFPQVEANIFISHSHDDADLACALAGWLNQTFGLNCFIDSNVWGYSENLLEIMNSKLSNKRKSKDSGVLYNHDSCNRVSQHVNMMLSVALQKMIDKVEVVILLNTNNSISVCTDNKMSKTYSPWIYLEIIFTQLVKRKPLFVYRNYKQLIHSDLAKGNYYLALEQFLVSYKFSLEHLIQIEENDLSEWEMEYQREEYEYSLDALYKLFCPKEVESAKEMSIRLSTKEVDYIKSYYFGRNKDVTRIKYILENVMEGRCSRHICLYCGECCYCRECFSSKYNEEKNW